MQTILKDGKLLVEQVRQSQRTPLVSVLIHGTFRIRTYPSCMLRAAQALLDRERRRSLRR